MTRKVLRSVVVAGAVAVLTAGCGTPSVGSAATVGDRRISVHDLQNATHDLQAFFGPDQPLPQRSVLYLIAATPYVQKIAVRAGAGSSIDDARKLMVSRKVMHASTAALQVMQSQLSLSQIQQTKGDAALNALLVELSKDLHDDGLSVNPRYGTFDYTRGGITPDAPNWLPKSSTAAAAQ